MNMKALDRVKNLDQSYKIGLILFAALAVGFVANSFQSPASMGANTAYTDYKAQTEDLAASRGALPVADGASGQSAADPGSSDRKIITTVRTTLKVSDVSEAQENTRQLVDHYNGFIESSSIDQRNQVSGRMTVAIPDENLSEFTSGLESSYRVESQSTDRTDVTDRYNELEAELEAKQQEMQQLEDLMDRAENVSELVKIQERMSELRSRIDFLQRQLDDLDDRVRYSRVHITYEGPELLRASFSLQETLFQAYRAVFDSVRLMILGAAYLLPFLVLVGLYRLLKPRVEL